MDVGGFRTVSRRGRGCLNICEPEIVEKGEEANRFPRAASCRKKGPAENPYRNGSVFQPRRRAILGAEGKSGTSMGIETAKITSTGSLTPDQMVLQLLALGSTR